MSPINLLPQALQARRRQRLFRRRWTWVCAAYATVLGLAALAVRLNQRLDDHYVRAEIARATADADTLEGRQENLSVAFRKLADERVLRDIVNSPADYGQLLAILRTSMDGKAVLTQFRCELAAGAAAKPAGPGTARADLLANPVQLKVELSGLVREQPAVARLVQTIRETGLFDDVRLVKSSREGFLDGNAYAFRLECVASAAQAGGLR